MARTLIEFRVNQGVFFIGPKLLKREHWDINISASGTRVFQRRGPHEEV